MKKNLILTIISIFLTSSIFCQNITDEGNEWQLGHYSLGNWVTSSFKVEGDTLLNAKLYKKVYRNFENQTKSLAYLIRMDSMAKVFSLENDVEYIIYDFGAEVGDTIVSYFDTSWVAQVEAIDTIELLDGTLRKRQKLVSLKCPDFQQVEYWIEGIGGQEIFPFRDQSEGFCVYDNDLKLNCFHANNELLWGPRLGGECDLILNTLELEKPQFTIFPNPVSDFIYITLDNPKNGVFQLLNIQGNILLEKKVNHEILASGINLSKYPIGIYMIRYIENDTTMQTKRIVVQR